MGTLARPTEQCGEAFLVRPVVSVAQVWERHGSCVLLLLPITCCLCAMRKLALTLLTTAGACLRLEAEHGHLL